MDVQTLKLDMLSNDLDCYSHVMSAMESSAVFDMGIIRGQYADLHHRYVTMQPTHFKRTAISAGMENGMVTVATVAGAAILLGILIKISKWIADFFFGGSSNGAGGGGGGGKYKTRSEIMFVVINEHRIITFAKELAGIAKDLGNEKPVGDWVDKLKSNFQTVCSDSQARFVKSWVDAIHDTTRKETSFVNPFVKMSRTFHNDPAYDPMSSPDYQTFKQNYDAAYEGWEKAEDYMQMLKKPEGNVVSGLKSKTVAALLQDYLKFGDVFIETRNYGFSELPEVLDLAIKGNVKQVTEIKKMNSDSQASKNMIDLIEQMTRMQRAELKHVTYMAILLSDYFDMALHFCSLLTSFSDKLSESNSARVKEIHAELIKIKMK